MKANESTLTVINWTQLDAVSGGGTNKSNAEGSAKIELPGFKGEVSGKVGRERSDYKVCLDRFPKASGETIVKTCGLPPK